MATNGTMEPRKSGGGERRDYWIVEYFHDLLKRSSEEDRSKITEAFKTLRKLSQAYTKVRFGNTTEGEEVVVFDPSSPYERINDNTVAVPNVPLSIITNRIGRWVPEESAISSGQSPTQSEAADSQVQRKAST